VGLFTFPVLFPSPGKGGGLVQILPLFDFCSDSLFFFARESGSVSAVQCGFIHISGNLLENFFHILKWGSDSGFSRLLLQININY